MTKSIEQLEQQLADIQVELVKMKDKQQETPVATPWVIAADKQQCFYVDVNCNGEAHA